jgi:hypothetical protein
MREATALGLCALEKRTRGLSIVSNLILLSPVTDDMKLPRTDISTVNDLPPETVQAIARLASDAKDNEALAPRRQKTPKGSPKRGSPVIKNKATKCDKRLQPLKTTGMMLSSIQPPANSIKRSQIDTI